MTQPEVATLPVHERQKHADNIDMLPKELIIRAFTAPEDYMLIPVNANDSQQTAEATTVRRYSTSIKR